MSELTAVNVPARRAFAELLRQFHSGRMTNFEFEDRFDAIEKRFGDDRGVRAVYFANWFTYCDLFKHRMTDADRRFSPENRRVIARWVLFLKSDCLPPERAPRTYLQVAAIPFFLVAAVALGLTRLLAFAVLAAARSIAVCVTHRAPEAPPARSELAENDNSPWPFRSESDFQRALARPCYLAGVSA